MPPTAHTPIVVRRYGAVGPTVVVLHGGPGAPGSAVGLARMLARSFQVLEPLQRRADGVPLTVDRHVEDLSAVVPRAAVVGWSWGAMLGLAYAARYPERVIALVLVSCGTFSEADRRLYQTRLNAALGPSGQHRQNQLREAIDKAPNASRREKLLNELFQVLGAAQDIEVDDEEPTSVQVDAQGNRETWDDVLRRQAMGQEPAAFASIKVPVLMLHGEEDPHPGPAIRATLQAFLPQLEYVSFPRCGHRPWAERRARVGFERVLVDWLNRDGAGLAHVMQPPRG